MEFTCLLHDFYSSVCKSLCFSLGFCSRTRSWPLFRDVEILRVVVTVSNKLYRVDALVRRWMEYFVLEL